MYGWKKSGSGIGEDKKINTKTWVWERTTNPSYAIEQYLEDKGWNWIRDTILASGHADSHGYQISDMICMTLEPYRSTLRYWDETNNPADLYIRNWGGGLSPVNGKKLWTYQDGIVDANSKYGSCYAVGFIFIDGSNNYPDADFIKRGGITDGGPVIIIDGFPIWKYSYYSMRHIYDLNRIKREDGTDIPGSDKIITGGMCQYKHGNMYYSMGGDGQDEHTIEYESEGLLRKRSRTVITDYGHMIPDSKLVNICDLFIPNVASGYVTGTLPNLSYMEYYPQYYTSTAYEMAMEHGSLVDCEEIVNRYLINIVERQPIYINGHGYIYFSGAYVLGES